MGNAVSPLTSLTLDLSAAGNCLNRSRGAVLNPGMPMNGTSIASCFFGSLWGSRITPDHARSDVPDTLGVVYKRIKFADRRRAGTVQRRIWTRSGGPKRLVMGTKGKLLGAIPFLKAREQGAIAEAAPVPSRRRCRQIKGAGSGLRPTPRGKPLAPGLGWGSKKPRRLRR